MQKWASIIFLLFTQIASAQEIENIDDLSLEDLLNIKTSVASKTERSTRESPGIVTVLTKDELRKMGARDLMDALKFVPGFNFGHDVQGVIGLGVRGNWGHEGKFSLMVDGVEMNEILYSTTQFGNHYPIDHIKQIEIIRGPGSAIYGGYAELAVVHIITERGADLNGGKVVATYGQMREDFGRRNLSVQYGTKIEDWDISAAAMIGRSRLGDGPYTGFVANDTPPPEYLSETYDYSQGDAHVMNPAWFNVGVSNSKLDFRFIYDNYKITNRGQYGYSGLTKGIPIIFESIFTSLKYDFDIMENFKLTPYVQHKSQYPWKQNDAETINAGSELSDINATRTKVGVSGLWDMGEISTLLVGLEYYKDKAVSKNFTDDGINQIQFSLTGTQDVDFDGVAAYAQDSLKFSDIEVTVGARWEQLKTPTGRKVSKTVPRLAVTHASKTWHVKGLASQAYRVPSIFNFETDLAANGSSTIKPEVTTTFEVESGIATSSNAYLTLNIFSTQIKDPIVYIYTGTDNYLNFPRVGTNGAELEYKVKYPSGFTNINYSFYQRSKNEVPSYDVPDSKELLGLPQHKATVLSSYKTGWGNLFVNPSVVYMSSKHSYAYDAVNDAKILERLDSSLLVNLYLSYPDLFLPGLEAGFGVFNIFDDENRIVQPYDGDLGSVPGASREFLARLTYSLSF